MNTWLDSTYAARFSPEVIQMIGTTQVIYGTSSDNPTGHAEQFWVPSCVELTSSPPGNADSYDSGCELLPTADLLRTPNQILRTAFVRGSYWLVYRMYWIDSSGNFSEVATNSLYGGVRPCFTLPETVHIHESGNLIEKIY